jgi:hypothetical protein
MRSARLAAGVLALALSARAQQQPAPAPPSTTAAPANTPLPPKDARAPVDPNATQVDQRPAPSDPTAPPPAEYTLVVKEGAWRVRVTLRPGQPEPGQVLEVLLDVARHPEIPDPTYGDRLPLQGATLALTMSGPGQRSRHRAWPLGDAGIYGVHWTPPARGLWTLSLEPLEGKPEAPRLSFQVGVGVPMPASSEGQAVRSTRVVLAGAPAPRASGKQTVRELMQELTRHWLALDRAGADAKAELAALGPLADALQGTAPAAFSAEAAEYDALARALRTSVDRVAAGKREEHVKLQNEEEATTCLQCHAKFRDRVVEDLRGWPEVKPWKR